MNKQIGKNMFDGMELPEQTETGSVGKFRKYNFKYYSRKKGYTKTVFGSDGLEKQRLHSL